MQLSSFKERADEPGTITVYADDMSVDVVGDTLRLTFYELRRVGGNVVKVPVVEIIRQRSALKCLCREAMKSAGIQLCTH